MKRWNRWKQESWFPYTFAAIAGVIVFMILSNITIFLNFFLGLWTLVKPLLYGFILAYLIDPIARFFEKKIFHKMKKPKIRRSLSVILGVVTVVVVVGGLAAAVIPSLVKSISNIFETFSVFVQNLDKNAGHITADLPFGLGNTLANFSINETVLEKASEFVQNNLQNIANTSVSVGSGFANFIIAFVLGIYYMMDKERLLVMARRGFIMVLKEKRYEYFHDFMRRADIILLQYIKGNLIEAFIVACVNALFMAIAGLPYVLLVSVVVGITNIAPTFGPIVGAAIGAIMLVLINPWYALIFLIFTVVLQTVDGYIIKPKLFGETLGVSPLLILICIILGGRLYGVIGILLAIPFAAIAQLVADDMWKKRKVKKTEEETPKDDNASENNIGSK